MAFGAGATLIACLLEAYASRFLFIAALWQMVINGLVVGTELYFFLNVDQLPWYVVAGWVALGELIAMAFGYALFMFLIRNNPS